MRRLARVMFGNRETAFNRFGKKLKPVLKKIGMQGVTPKIFPLTRFIKS
jgi:hypothetical protein